MVEPLPRWAKVGSALVGIAFAIAVVAWWLDSRVGDDAAPADWRIDQAAELNAASRAVPIVVNERSCSSGRSAEGRIDVSIDYSEDAVQLEVGVRPLGGNQDCQGNPDTPYVVELTEALGDRPVTGEFGAGQIVGVAADPTGGGWVMERSGERSEVSVGRLGGDGTVVVVGELPPAASFSFVGLADGGLAAGVRRCEPSDDSSDDCQGNVSELVILDADGQVTSSTVLSRRSHDSSPGDRVVLVGQVDSAVWVMTDDSQLVRVTPDGEVAESIPARAQGGLCMIGGVLYAMTVVEGEVGPEISPTSDPAHPDRYTVKRVENGAFVTVDRGALEAPSNSIGDCVGDAFEVSATKAEAPSYWTPADGWTTQPRGPDPQQPRSEPSVDRWSERFIIDGTGTLLVEVKGTWEPTPLQFETLPPPAGSHNVLRANRSGDVVVACVIPIDGTAEAECHTAAT